MSDPKITPAIAEQFPKHVIPLVKSAGQTIDILMYEWKWYGHESAGGVQKLNHAIIGAARRNIKIRALLNIESMGHAITKINTRTGNFLMRYGCEVKFYHVGHLVHAKMMIIDKKILILGSHNWTKSAFSRNKEASIIVEGVNSIKPYRQYFDDLWDQNF